MKHVEDECSLGWLGGMGLLSKGVWSKLRTLQVNNWGKMVGTDGVIEMIDIPRCLLTLLVYRIVCLDS